MEPPPPQVTAPPHAPQLSVPPQPSEMLPQFLPRLPQLLATQAPQVLLLLHVVPAPQVPQLNEPPQPSPYVPQTLPPGQATSGVQAPHVLALAPPPQVWPATLHVPQLSATPQPLSGVPHVAPRAAHVVGTQGAAVHEPATHDSPALHAWPGLQVQPSAPKQASAVDSPARSIAKKARKSISTRIASVLPGVVERDRVARRSIMVRPSWAQFALLPFLKPCPAWPV